MICRYHCTSPNDLYPPHKVIYIFSAYELYANLKSARHRARNVGDTDGEGKTTMAARFKKAFSYENVTVHFVGAWCVIKIFATEKQNDWS